MLKFLRKKTKVIIWSIVIAFISWGGYAVNLQFQEAGRAPGSVFGKEVSFRDYLLAERAVQIFLLKPADDKTPPAPEDIESKTWEFLVFQREAKQRKIKVTDDELREGLYELLAAGKEVPFTGEQYAAWVKANFREEPRDFEDQLREMVRIQKLMEEMRNGFKENPDENLKRWQSELISRANIRVYQ